MASSRPIEIDFEFLPTKTNVPFSWEAKPGVPKPQSQPSPTASLFEIEATMLKLPSPPCRSESARLSGDYSGLITYSPPRCRAESARMAKDFLWLEAYSDGSASSFGFGCCKSDDSKKTDPFVEAYKKCRNSRSINGASATNGAKRPNIIRRVLFSLSRFWC
ncbi:uncharacterized protein LOC101203728 [Cucumis sativus]|uniref:uncharacterized protein LOC101203728 n=1 Tax=Cucumis sativus TaxID=3659 RepID=UPI0002B41394|nr:uncharacterized protein LOC101203728 [Cucumis sativus]KAE8649894.1 hypothetical protein Csa_012140 [Cucumis sativus]